MKYIRKPLMIDAIQCTSGTIEEVILFSGGNGARCEISELEDDNQVICMIDVGGSILNAKEGDYLVKQDGNFFLLSKSAFEYEFEEYDQSI